MKAGPPLVDGESGMLDVWVDLLFKLSAVYDYVLGIHQNIAERLPAEIPREWREGLGQYVHGPSV